MAATLTKVPCTGNNARAIVESLERPVPLLNLAGGFNNGFSILENEMNEIIRVEERDGMQFVNARELHKALEVGRDFATWIRDRIYRYVFIEDTDFSPVLGRSTGGRPSSEYLLSVNMAKELAILENNEKGQSVRQHLIKIETAWNTPEMIMARALQVANKTIDAYRTMAISPAISRSRSRPREAPAFLFCL